jgi:hypothetical protein
LSNIKFTATKLAAKGKKGVLPFDENGYYTMPIGGLNVYNSAGQYYTLEGAKQLFEASSIFMRRVQNGCLKAEVGHPKRLPGQSMDDYMSRILSIEETNTCAHFKEIWLDESYGKNNPQFKNPNMVAIMAKVKPSGPKGDSLRASFENPDENVCFSIRSLTRDYFEKGQCYRVLQQVVTWDFVTEAGIHIANKWDSPALESEDLSFTSLKGLETICNSQDLVALEDTKILALEALQVLLPNKVNGRRVSLPKYSNW